MFTHQDPSGQQPRLAAHILKILATAVLLFKSDSRIVCMDHTNTSQYLVINPDFPNARKSLVVISQ